MRERTIVPKEGFGTKDAGVPAVLLCLLAGFLAGCGGSKPPAPPPEIAVAAADSASAPQAQSELEALVAAEESEAVAEASAAPGDSAATQAAAVPALLTPEVDTYRILVDDQLNLLVVGYPELSGVVRVLPDGTITVPGAGTIYVLGATIAEATAKVNEILATIIRFPRVTVTVAEYGERLVFVMGEVVAPGDHLYQRGLTTVGAIAMAGGFNNYAKRSSVIVLRRTSEGEALAFRVDTRDPLAGRRLETDIPLRPFDIVYVPKTFIASVGVLLDQYFAQLTPPFSLYLLGWRAFHIDDTNIRFETIP